MFGGTACFAASLCARFGDATAGSGVVLFGVVCSVLRDADGHVCSALGQPRVHFAPFGMAAQGGTQDHQRLRLDFSVCCCQGRHTRTLLPSQTYPRQTHTVLQSQTHKSPRHRLGCLTTGRRAQSRSGTAPVCFQAGCLQVCGNSNVVLALCGLRHHMQKKPLHWAGKGGHAEAARMLIAAGADINVRNMK
eukprot:31441-Rhodomonas_salina.1